MSHEPLEQVAAAIGRSCYWWSSIEIELQELCSNLARFIDRSFEREEVWEVIAISLSHMDIRQRIAVAKALAANGVDPDLYDSLERLLNRIDNELRAERNRYIHDQWTVLDETIIRRRQGAKVIRPQSRTLEVRHSYDRAYASIDEVNDFAERLATALSEVLALNQELSDLYLEIWPPEESASPAHES